MASKKWSKKIRWGTFNLFFMGLMFAHGQENILDSPISIRFDKVSVKEAFDQLAKKIGYSINYTASFEKREINRSFRNQKLEKVLRAIWGNPEIRLVVKPNSIYLLPEKSKRSSAQEGTIMGKVSDNFDQPVPFASVFLQNTTYGTEADGNGNFFFSAPPGEYTLVVSMLGFQEVSEKILVPENGKLNVNIAITYADQQLTEVIVTGKTKATAISEEAITISSLDIKQFQDQAIGAEEVLKTTTGLVVRQSGGLGSNININLNGLSGNAVRVFYDDIPLDVYGNGLPLNAIPVDALERVDVYKGVMPIDVGTDALGGGLNLVPAQQNDDYLRTSYSVGSFNTHRFTFNGLKKLSDRTSLSTISYLNYSDNDYKMRNIPNLIEIELPDGSPGVGEERINARRFHDQHISGYIEGKLRIKDLKWADRLELALSYSRRDDEIQNGGIISNTATGEAETEIDVLASRIDYRKTFFKDRLKARYFGVLSYAVDNVKDSTVNLYNWRGEILSITNASGSEIFGRPSFLERDNLGTAHRLTLNYRITDNLDFKVSDYYRYTRLEGEDPLAERVLINGELTDPNTLPATLNRNIFGAELNANLFKDKLNVITFYKNYFYRAKSIDIFQVGASQLEFSEIQKHRNGYGLALKYEPHPTFFIRTSVEQAIRIPTERELFGDLATVLPNLGLEPEESLNWNVGVQFEKRFKNDRSILVNLNGFIRNRENLIRPLQITNDLLQFINETEVDGKGIEAVLKIDPLKNLSLQGSFTAQSNEISAGFDMDSQVPNIPLTFYNVRANYRIEDLFEHGNNLQLSWTFLFTDQFSINIVEDLNTANPDFIVPEQYVHNFGLTYLLKPKGMAFSFNLQNVFNAEVFDNFRIPRPGINYAFKINYSL